MNVHRTGTTATPRLVLVGLLIFASACRHRPPANVPASAPAPTPPPAPAKATITTAAMLIQAMHDRYAGTWYHTLTFKQKTTLGLPSGGEIVQTWYEAGKFPGRLRIDTDLASKAGVLFAHDSIFNFTGGKLVRADTGLNELVVLGFDVYDQPISRTESILRGLGFDLSRFHEGTWQGTQVYVIGAVRGDTLSKQFWVERDRLLFVRMFENGRQGHTDVRFSKYVPAGRGWVATEVTQLVNGKRRIFEQYSDVRTDVELADALFDPRRWASSPHWAVP